MIVITAVVGTMQYVRIADLLAARRIGWEGTTSTEQLSQEFAQKYSEAAYLGAGGVDQLAIAQRSLFWVGDWPNLGLRVLDSPGTYLTLVGGAICALSLAPLLGATIAPASRRVLRNGDRPARERVIAAAYRSSFLYAPWLALLAAPIVWWLVSDRTTVRIGSLDQWPGSADGASKPIGMLLLVAALGIGSLLASRRSAQRQAWREAAFLGLCPRCGYQRGNDPREFPICPECGHADAAVSDPITEQVPGKRVIAPVVALVIVAAGTIAAVNAADPDGPVISWILLRSLPEARPFLVVRANEVLELTFSNEHVLVAWRCVFDPASGAGNLKPLAVISVWKHLHPPPLESGILHVDHTTPITVNASSQWLAHIPAGRCGLSTYLGTWDTRRGDFATSMVYLNFANVHAIRRWQPDGDDPQIGILLKELDRACTDKRDGTR